MAVKEGNTVKVEYTGKLADGSVFDSSVGREPLEFTVGEKQVIAGFEDGILGMNVEETKELVIQPEQAYGRLREDLVQEVPKEKLPEGAEVGMMLAVSIGPGQQIPATITKLDEETATLDLNHPLAGKTLHFTITVKDIQ